MSRFEQPAPDAAAHARALEAGRPPSGPLGCRPEWPLEAALYAVVGGTVLALGGTPRALHPALWAAGAGLLVALVARGTAGGARSERPSLAAGPLLLPGLALAAWTVVQLLPVRGGRPISISPPDTARGLAFVALTVVIHATASSILRSGRAVRRRPRWIVAIGLALALAGLFQKASGSQLIYGRFAPEPDGIPYGPFWYRNHFAACMLITIPAALHLVLEALRSYMRRPTHDLRWRVVASGLSRNPQLLEWTAVALVLLASLLASGSRGGLLALLAGGAAAVAVGASRAGWRLWLLMTAILSLPLLWFGLGPVAARLPSTATDAPARLMVWDASLELARSYWPMGAGLNAFPAALAGLPEVRDRVSAVHRLNARASHDDYLQAVVETGLPGLAIGLWALFAVVRSSRRDAWRLAAVVGLLAHATVDFLFQVPAVALLFVTVAADVPDRAFEARHGR